MGISDSWFDLQHELKGMVPWEVGTSNCSLSCVLKMVSSCTVDSAIIFVSLEYRSYISGDLTSRAHHLYLMIWDANCAKPKCEESARLQRFTTASVERTRRNSALNGGKSSPQQWSLIPDPWKQANLHGCMPSLCSNLSSGGTWGSRYIMLYVTWAVAPAARWWYYVVAWDYWRRQ